MELSKKEQGKKSRRQGKAFELKVRADLEDKGWIVDRWSNNVENDKIVPAKSKWNNFTHSMMMGSGGFPDFIAFKQNNSLICGVYKIIGVEVKIKGTLSKVEKEKLRWLLDNNIFSKILVASKEKEGRKVVVKYKEFGNKLEMKNNNFVE